MVLPRLSLSATQNLHFGFSIPPLTLSGAGRLLGHKGGSVTSRKMTPEQKRARAKKAAAARWSRSSEKQK